MTRLFDKLVFGKNNSSKPVFKRNNGNGKIDGFGIINNNIKHAKKLGKLSKLKKSKSEKFI